MMLIKKDNNLRGETILLFIFLVGLLVLIGSVFIVNPNFLNSLAGVRDRYPLIVIPSPTPSDTPLEFGKFVLSNQELKNLFDQTYKENPTLVNIEFIAHAPKSITPQGQRGNFENPIESDPIWVFSPDKSKAISTLLYYLEPDSSLEIYNWRQGNEVLILKSCGTPCDYWGTLWLNNDRFVFIGSHETGSVGKPKYVVSVSLYDLERETEVLYETKEMDQKPKIPKWTSWQEQIRGACKKHYPHSFQEVCSKI